MRYWSVDVLMISSDNPVQAGLLLAFPFICFYKLKILAFNNSLSDSD
jgi:hypothetical protein